MYYINYFIFQNQRLHRMIILTTVNRNWSQGNQLKSYLSPLPDQTQSSGNIAEVSFI